MSNLKCFHCGLVNWASATHCQRCFSQLQATSQAPAPNIPRPTNYQPSLAGIIWTDYTTALIFIFSGVLWVGYFLFGFLGIPLFRRGRSIDLSGPGLLIAASAFTVLLVPIAIYRIRSVMALFSKGIEVRAIITQSEFYEGRGTIQYNYLYQGKSYEGSTTVRKNYKTENLASLGELTVLIDPSSPQRAIIRDFYTH